MLDVKALLTKMLTSINNVLTVQNTYGVAYGVSSSLTLSTSGKKIPLNTFTGNNCQLSSNGLKVSKGGMYKIDGSAYYSTGYTVNDIVHLAIYVNSTSGLECVKRVYSTSPYEIIHVGPFIKELQANDVVYLYAYNQTGARGTVATHGNTRLTLTRIN